jgi:hypothetical protein
MNQRDDGAAGVSDASCAASRYPISFDGQLFPTLDSDLAVTGFSTAEAAADADLADRMVSPDVPALDVTYSVIGAISRDGSNTIVRAELRSDDAVGTVDVTPAVELTDIDTRWIVQAAAPMTPTSTSATSKADESRWASNPAVTARATPASMIGSRTN